MGKVKCNKAGKKSACGDCSHRLVHEVHEDCRTWEECGLVEAKVRCVKRK